MNLNEQMTLTETVRQHWQDITTWAQLRGCLITAAKRLRALASATVAGMAPAWPARLNSVADQFDTQARTLRNANLNGKVCPEFRARCLMQACSILQRNASSGRRESRLL